MIGSEDTRLPDIVSDETKLPILRGRWGLFAARCALLLLATLVLFSWTGWHVLLPLFGRYCKLVYVGFGIVSIPASVLLAIVAVAAGVRAISQKIPDAQVESNDIAKSAIATGAVSGVLAVFLGFMLWPIVPGTIGSLQLTMSQRNLEQLGLALRQYHEDYGCFPPAAACDSKGQALLSWRVLILPFLQGPQNRETTLLFEQFHLDEPWDSPHNRRLIGKMPRVFSNPFDHDREQGMASYLAIAGPETVFPPDRVVHTSDIRDGESQTILLIEIGSSRTPWTKPEDLQLEFAADPKRITSAQGWGARHILFADGKVRIVSTATDPKVWRALLTIAGGESIDDDDF
jgi:hypothetical protein